MMKIERIFNVNRFLLMRHHTILQVLMVVAVWLVPSVATAQDERSATPVEGTGPQRGSWTSQSPTHLLSAAAAELFWRFSESLSSLRSKKAPEPTLLLTQDELQKQAYAELGRLEEIKRPLTSVDTQPFWSSVRQLNDLGYDAYHEVIALYTAAGELDLCLDDYVEVCRLVGQNHKAYGRFTDAARYFNAAETAFEAASAAEKRSSASTMANVLYLRGAMLHRLEDSDQGMKNDIELVTNPLFARHLEMVTRMSILERIGDQMVKLSRIDEAQSYYQKAVELVTTSGDLDRQREEHVRLALKELLARAKARQFENKELREALRSLQKQFQNKDYSGFEQILQAIVVADEELDDKEAMIADLGTLRTWYFKQLKSGRHRSIFEHRWRREVVEASKLLIMTLWQTNQKAKSQDVIRETEQQLELDENWKQGLPVDLLKSSVLEVEK